MEITLQEKEVLLKTARNFIEVSLDETVKLFEPDLKSELLHEHHGAFVTLTEAGNLRGCIGYIISEQPLLQTIRDAAYGAAFEDPRFPKLSPEQLEMCDVEISVLSKPFPINSYDEIIIGKHGLIVTEGFKRGLLLPQVPVEHHLNRDQYLSALCQKAGIYPEYWKEKKLDLEGFTAEVFSEKDLEKK
ncbi:MAG: TIGR00296 family protein [Melioribacteraceae bacterium]|nr:MAG: TIGR00296 family protein [Melioribacteraceae bacterium]